jgi:hypothetical protein
MLSQWLQSDGAHSYSFFASDQSSHGLDRRICWPIQYFTGTSAKGTTGSLLYFKRKTASCLSNACERQNRAARGQREPARHRRSPGHLDFVQRAVNLAPVYEAFFSERFQCEDSIMPKMEISRRDFVAVMGAAALGYRHPPPQTVAQSLHAGVGADDSRAGRDARSGNWSIAGRRPAQRTTY